MRSKHVSGTPETVVHEIVSDTTETVQLCGPPEELVTAAITVADHLEEPPTVEIRAAESVLRSVRDDFATAWIAAEQVETGSLTLRTIDDSQSVLALADETIWTIGSVGEVTVADGVTDTETEETIREVMAQTHAPRLFDLRTPSRAAALEAAATGFSETLRTDFETAIDTLSTLNADPIDAVHVAVLVGAANEVLLYELSSWMEQIGIASRATVSRKKNEVEDAGLLTTEKVPVDVGRPRQRLRLAGSFREQDNRDSHRIGGYPPN